MNRSDLTPEVTEALEQARRLADAGIPIFVGYPDKSNPGEFHLPRGWQKTEARREYVDAWRRGFALCAVMGRGIDLVDIDPRNGGAVESIRAQLPPVYGEAATPSGGQHLFVASLGIRSRDDILPGIDVKAGDADGEGRGFAFIAPTVRRSKVSGKFVRYRWMRAVDLDALSNASPEEGERLAALVNARRQPSRGSAGPSGGEVIPEGTRNTTLASLAGSMRRRGMTEAAILAALRVENGRCLPPLDETEVAQIVASMARYSSEGDHESPKAIKHRGDHLRGGEARTPQIVRLSDVAPQAVDWLWRGYMPRGKLTLIDGDPGQMKSTVTLDLAARITTGRPMPDGSPGLAGGVVLMTFEDGLADTVRPRFDAAGGDPERVVVLRGIGEGDDERLPTLPDDIDAIRAAVLGCDAVLVVIDPLMAALSSDVNSYRDQDVRRVLAQLTRVAEELHVAVVVVRHLNKATNGKALYRGGGSIGIAGAARSVLLAAPSPSDREAHVLASVKSNLEKRPQSIGYRAVTSENGQPKVEWLGAVEYDADDLLLSPATGTNSSALKAAEAFLVDILQDGGRSADEVERLAAAAGISASTLRRAKAAMEIQSVKAGMAEGWRWVLRADATEVMDL